MLGVYFDDKKSERIWDEHLVAPCLVVVCLLVGSLTNDGLEQERQKVDYYLSLLYHNLMSYVVLWSGRGSESMVHQPFPPPFPR